MTTFDTPGVYIQEVTGPGVIQRVGTSVAAFVGVAGRGPSNTPRLVTTFDQFADLFGTLEPHGPHFLDDGQLYYLSLAVRGFFENGGSQAYIVRADNGQVGSLDLQNGDGTTVATIAAASPELNPTATIVDLADAPLTLAVPAAVVQPPAGPSPIAGDGSLDLLLDDASGFEVGDEVTDGITRATIADIAGNWIRPSQVLVGPDLQTPDLSSDSPSIRVDTDADAVAIGARLTVTNSDGDSIACIVDAVGGNRLSITIDGAAPAIVLHELAPTATIAQLTMASGIATVTDERGGGVYELDDVTSFRPGDRVTDATGNAIVLSIDDAASTVTLDAELVGAGTLTIANLTTDYNRFRATDARGLRLGSLVLLDDGANQTNAVVAAVDSSGFVTLADTPARTAEIAADTGTAAILEISLIVEHGDQREAFPGLSVSPTSSRYLFQFVDSTLVNLVEPEPPLRLPLDQLIPQPASATLAGTPSTPRNLGVTDYRNALEELERVDAVNMISAPDAVFLSDDERRTVQNTIINHCVQQGDRMAIIDPPPDLPPSGPGSILDVRGDVQSERGFAALYYPWLTILDPTRIPPLTPRRISVPPSGHICGVMARTDAQRGVFKAPANTPVRAVLDVQRRLTDREQGPLNRGGTNVLRVLPGSNDVTVWGARTTVDPVITDWIYVNVRRLLFFIEESIQEGIRWAVFEPNDQRLWKSLERVIRTFLRDQWRAGALFGDTEEQAFLIKIDEGNNPEHVRAVGRLNITIRVAPVRPAEFIVINIGLSQEGVQIEEG